jgi:hypothetical protein
MELLDDRPSPRLGTTLSVQPRTAEDGDTLTIILAVQNLSDDPVPLLDGALPRCPFGMRMTAPEEVPIRVVWPCQWSAGNYLAPHGILETRISFTVYPPPVVELPEPGIIMPEEGIIFVPDTTLSVPWPVDGGQVVPGEYQVKAGLRADASEHSWAVAAFVVEEAP